MASHLVGQNQIATFITPVNGTSPIDANQVRGNDNQIKVAYNSHDLDPTLHIQDSPIAARPAATTEGRKWMTTDTGGIRLWYDTGAAWQELAYLPASGGTFTGPVTFASTTQFNNVATFSTAGVPGNPPPIKILSPDSTKILQLSIDNTGVAAFDAGATAAFAFKRGATSIATIDNTGQFSANGATHTFGTDTTGSTTLDVNGAAATIRGIRFRTASSTRWHLRENAVPEGGADVGSNFELAAYSDLGIIIDTPISITRVAGGAIAITRPMTLPSLIIGTDPGGAQLLRVGSGIVAGGVTSVFGSDTASNPVIQINGATSTLRTILFRTASLTRWSIRTNNSVEAGADAGSDLQIVAFTDAGTSIDNPLVIARAAGGTITVARPLSTLGITVNNAAGIAFAVQGASFTGVDGFHVEMLTRRTAPIASTDPRPNNGEIYLTNLGGAGTPLPFSLVGTMVFQTRANNTSKRGFYWLHDDPAATLMSIVPSADLNIYSAAPDNVRVIGNRVRTSLQAPTPAQANDALVQLAGGSYDTAAYQAGAMYSINATETWSPTARGSELRFYTVPTTTTVQTLQWRILPAGSFRPETDAAQDVGAAANQVRDIYASSSLRITTTGGASAGAIRLVNAAQIAWRNVGGVGNITLAVTGASDFLTSSTPITAPNHISTGAASGVAAGIAYGGTTAATATTGAAGAPPAQVTGYVIINVAGATGKIPYYNN